MTMTMMVAMVMVVVVMMKMVEVGKRHAVSKWGLSPRLMNICRERWRELE